MSLGTGALKVSRKGPVVIQAPHDGIFGNLQTGNTVKQLLTGTSTLEHAVVEETLTWPNAYLCDQVALGREEWGLMNLQIFAIMDCKDKLRLHGHVHGSPAGF